MGKSTGKKVAALGQTGNDRELTLRKTFYIPPNNPYFIGREKYLTKLHQQFQDTGAAVISGLGGVGKSQTAIEYAHRYAKPNDDYEQCYDWAFWVKADTDLNLESGFAEIARQVGIAKPEQTQPELVQAAKRWLETTSDRWLLIFDNADTPSLLKPYRCQNTQGRTLLTSRTDSFAVMGIRQPLALEEMSESEAVAFLWERTDRVRPDSQTAEDRVAATLANE